MNNHAILVFERGQLANLGSPVVGSVGEELRQFLVPPQIDSLPRNKFAGTRQVHPVIDLVLVEDSF